MFQEVFKKLKPDIFYHEINPVLEDARVRAFEKYGIKGVAAKRLKGISTSEIIEKIKNNKWPRKEKSDYYFSPDFLIKI